MRTSVVSPIGTTITDGLAIRPTFCCNARVNACKAVMDAFVNAKQLAKSVLMSEFRYRSRWSHRLPSFSCQRTGMVNDQQATMSRRNSPPRIGVSCWPLGIIHHLIRGRRYRRCTRFSCYVEKKKRIKPARFQGECRDKEFV